MGDGAASETPAAGATEGPSSLTLLGGRIGRDSLVYGASAVSTVVFGLASVAVMTRLLSPSDFGRVAVYGLVTATLTVFFNLGSLQGTMSVVFGGGGDEDDDGAFDLDAGAMVAGDRRKVLCTGILLTLIVGLIACLPILLLAGRVAPLLVHGDPSPHLVRIAAVAGVVAAMWRLTTNVARVERRPYAYVASHTAHPVLTLAVSVPLVATGGGVDGAVAGLAIGNLLAFLVALTLVRRSVRPGFSLGNAKLIYRRGTPRMFVALSFWLIANVDLYIVSRVMPAASVGLYRVGSRVGAMTSYWTSSFNMAYGPLRREPLYQAVEDEHGRYGVATAAVYFLAATTFVVLGLAVFADVLVRIADSRYRAAAPLIPVSALAFAGHGTYILSYRLASFPKRYRWLTIGAGISLVVFFAGAVFLTPAIGIYGPPLGALAGYAIGIVLMVWLTQKSAQPVPYQWRRMAMAILSGGLAYGAFRLLRTLVPELSGLVAIAALCLYLGLLVLTGAISRNAARVIAGVIRALPQRWSRRSMDARMRELAPADRALLELLARHRLDGRQIAAVNHSDEDVVLRRAVAVLRRCSRLDTAGPHDADIARYVLWAGAPALRDELGRRLIADGASPRDIHVLSMAFASFRQAPRSSWAQDGARRRRRSRAGIAVGR